MRPEELFKAGSRSSWPDSGESVLTVRDAAFLSCPSGRIAACGVELALRGSVDLTEFEVFQGPPGDYRLTLAIADFAPDEYYPEGFQRVAAAMLTYAGLHPGSWELHRRTLEADAGTAALFDLDHTASLRDLSKQDGADLQIIGETIDDRFTTRPHGPATPHLAFVECGMGDGSYDLWIGEDHDGTACSLVADMELLDHAQRR